MNDIYHRKINYIRVSVTDRCNLRCIYCKPAKGFQQLARTQILSYEEIIRLVQLAVSCGISKVRLTWRSASQTSIWSAGRIYV